MIEFAYTFAKSQIFFGRFEIIPTFATPFNERIGEMAEWSNAAVLKTVDVRASGGSNPSLSAAMQLSARRWAVFIFPSRASSSVGKNKKQPLCAIGTQAAIILQGPYGEY